MGEVRIRRAGPGDIPEIQRLYGQLDRYHAELLPDVFQPLEGDARGDEVIRAWIERRDAVYLLAELDGAVAGFVNVQRSMHPRYPMFRPHEFAAIDNAVVDAPYRGQGIGKRLFAAAAEWARENGLRYVQTTVWEANAAAKAFYLGQGFRPMTVRLELDTERDPGRLPGE